MPVDASQLLRRLEPAVRPVGARHAARPRTPIEAQDFDGLLQLVSHGRITSDRSITVRRGAADGLSPGQLQRLASAADLAESAGAQQALMLIDDRAVIVDIAERTLINELRSGESTTVVPVDAAVYVQPDDGPTFRAPLGPPGGGMMPASVAVQLADRALRIERDAQFESTSTEDMNRRPVG